MSKDVLETSGRMVQAEGMRTMLLAHIFRLVAGQLARTSVSDQVPRPASSPEREEDAGRRAAARLVGTSAPGCWTAAVSAPRHAAARKSHEDMHEGGRVDAAKLSSGLGHLWTSWDVCTLCVECVPGREAGDDGWEASGRRRLLRVARVRLGGSGLVGPTLKDGERFERRRAEQPVVGQWEQEVSLRSGG